jgi:hypothetical protein
LQPGETPPDGQPKRYVEGRGYIRLRWKVGPQQYVETYEHRLTAGVPAADVHHRDHVKGNNDSSNLAALTRSQHAREHGAHARSVSKSVTEWGGARSRQAFEKRQAGEARRADRQSFLAELAALRATGMTTTEIGAAVGRDASNISRALRAAGVAPRGAASVGTRVRQLVHARAQMCCERCGRNVVWDGGQCHHRSPRGMGGSRVAELGQPQNILYLCTDCHAWVESHRTEARAGGWLLSGRQEPLAVPVLVAGQRWVYLGADGLYRDVKEGAA